MKALPWIFSNYYNDQRLRHSTIIIIMHLLLLRKVKASEIHYPNYHAVVQQAYYTWEY